MLEYGAVRRDEEVERRSRRNGDLGSLSSSVQRMKEWRMGQTNTEGGSETLIPAILGWSESFHGTHEQDPVLPGVP